jgi:membrane protein
MKISLPFIDVLKKSFSLLSKNNPLLLASSTAFFTTFTLAPMLILITQILGLFFETSFILQHLFEKVASAIGEKSAIGIRKIVHNFLSLESSWWIKLLITIFFFFLATTLLGVIRQAIHLIWDIRKKPGKGFSFHFKARLVELVIFLSINVLFLFSLYLEDGIDSLQNLSFAVWVISALNWLVSVLITSIWFMLVFKLLPEVKIYWRMAAAGALITSILYSIGKFLLSVILTGSLVEKIFAQSSAVALLLLFIFYCSFIVYFGASFTFVYSKKLHIPVIPNERSDQYKEEVQQKGN